MAVSTQFGNIYINDEAMAKYFVDQIVQSRTMGTDEVSQRVATVEAGMRISNELSGNPTTPLQSAIRALRQLNKASNDAKHASGVPMLVTRDVSGPSSPAPSTPLPLSTDVPVSARMDESGLTLSTPSSPLPLSTDVPAPAPFDVSAPEPSFELIPDASMAPPVCHAARPFETLPTPLPGDGSKYVEWCRADFASRKKAQEIDSFRHMLDKKEAMVRELQRSKRHLPGKDRDLLNQARNVVLEGLDSLTNEKVNLELITQAAAEMDPHRPASPPRPSPKEVSKKKKKHGASS